MLEEKEIETFCRELTETDRASTMLICISGHKWDIPYGKIVNSFLDHAVAFKGLDQLIMVIDEICEMLGSPMLSMEPRFLKEDMAKRYKCLYQDKKKTPAEREAAVRRMIPYIAKAKGVLIVQVWYRQNSSIQGRVYCSFAGKRYISFRSALELMRMIKEASDLLKKRSMEVKAVSMCEGGADEAM